MRSRSRKCLMKRPWPNYSRICDFECRLDGMMHKWQVPPSSRSRLQFRYAVDIKLPITITGPQLLEVNYVNSPWLFERFNGGIPKSSSRHGWHGWPSIHVETHGDLGIHDFRWLQNPPMTPLVGAGSPTPATSPCAASPVNRAWKVRRRDRPHGWFVAAHAIHWDFVWWLYKGL